MKTILAMISLCLPSLNLLPSLIQTDRLNQEINFSQFKQFCLLLFGLEILHLSEFQINTEFRWCLRSLIMREYTSPTHEHASPLKNVLCYLTVRQNCIRRVKSIEEILLEHKEKQKTVMAIFKNVNYGECLQAKKF